MAYSTDLRESAVNYFLSHILPYKDVAAIFGIGSATLYRWVSKNKIGGCLEYGTSPGRPRLLDQEKDSIFREMLAQNADHTLEQLSEMWEVQQGQKLSTFCISRSIRRFGITRKKRHSGRHSEKMNPINKSCANICLN